MGNSYEGAEYFKYPDGQVITSSSATKSGNNCEFNAYELAIDSLVVPNIVATTSTGWCCDCRFINGGTFKGAFSSFNTSLNTANISANYTSDPVSGTN